MRKVLLMGGTGAMGVYVAPLLSALGYEIHITSRSDNNNLHPNIKFLRGNALNEKFIHAICKETRYDAIIDFMMYPTGLFEERIKFLLSTTGHYLFLSSYRVFADSDSTPLTECSPRLLDVSDDSRYLQTDEYALRKARQEDTLNETEKANWTILRPCITYSTGRFQFGNLEANCICYRAHHGLPVAIASPILEKRTTMTWAGDVARMISKIVLNDVTFGDTFNVVTSESQKWSTIGDYYSELMGLKIVETSLSDFEEIYCGSIGPASYQIRYDRMFNRVLDNSKVLRTTGIKQSELKSIHSGLSEELAKFMSSPSFPSLDFALLARMDRFCKTKTDITGFSACEKKRYLSAYHSSGTNPRYLSSRLRRVSRRCRKKILNLLNP